jgi:hypothetical protein
MWLNPPIRVFRIFRGYPSLSVLQSVKVAHFGETFFGSSVRPEAEPDRPEACSTQVFYFCVHRRVLRATLNSIAVRRAEFYVVKSARGFSAK